MAGMLDKFKTAVGLQEQEEKGLIGQIDEVMEAVWACMAMVAAPAVHPRLHAITPI